MLTVGNTMLKCKSAWLFIIVLFTILVNHVWGNTVGYVAYCPCMGRFGNQADHFLGALGFAKGVNRTLILPPWVEYLYGEPKSVQVPFDRYFKPEKLLEYHDVITMESFMKDIAPQIWPPSERVSFCYMARGNSNGCNAKEGNPFGPFWDTFNIDFVRSEIFGPLHYDVHHSDMGKKWSEQYPVDKWPVLAFTGAPGSFPVQLENRGLHKYLKWSDRIDNEAEEWIKNNVPKMAFIGIHLRNGIDWVRACEHIKVSPNLFAAAQCLGYKNEHGKATQEMCLPSSTQVIKKLRRMLRHTANIKGIVVASDNNHMIKDLQDAFKRMELKIVKVTGSSVHVELAVLGRAHHFIGNCISSFSSFIKRERDTRGLPSEFWGFPPAPTPTSHDEL